MSGQVVQVGEELCRATTQRLVWAEFATRRVK
jgi:hypothetical protein